MTVGVGVLDLSTKAGDKLIVAADNAWQGERLAFGEKFTAKVDPMVKTEIIKV